MTSVFDSPNPGEDVVAADVSQLTNSANGSADGGKIWALTQLDDAVNPALSVRNLNASGTALRVYKTVSSVDTDLLVVNNVTGATTIRNLYQRGPQIYDVEAFGAVGDGTTDDTAAIQSCISAVRTYLSGGQYTGAAVRFNSPSYAVSALDCTTMHNVLFMGNSGLGGVLIKATKQTTATHTSSGKAVFDGTATQACAWQGIVVDSSQVSGSNVIPMAAWLLSADGAGGNGTADRLTNCGSQGKFQTAPVITLYSSDHLFVGCAFQQYSIDRPVVLAGTVNPGTLGTITSLTTNTWPPSSVGSGGNLTFVGCEGHYLPASGGASAPYDSGLGSVLHVQDALGVRWYGGCIGSYGAAMVRVAGTSQGVLVDGAQCYSDDGSHQAKYLVNVAGSAVVNGLIIRGINLNSAVQNSSSSALVNIGAEAAITNLVLQGITGTYPAAARTIIAGGYASASTVAITEGDIECAGHPVNLNGSSHGPSLGGAVIFRDPGTISRDTAASTSCLQLSAGHTGFAVSNLPFPATSGGIGLPTQTSIDWRGGADAANLQGITSTSTDRIQIGATTNVVGTILNGTTDHDFQVAGTTKTKVTSAGLKPTRVVGDSVAAALVTGNFASLSAGWGSTASCSAVSGHELAGTFTITSNGSGTGSSPTLVFTYTGGAYAVAPTVIVLFIGGSGAGTIHQVGTTPGTTTCTLQFFFTPAGGGATYKYAVIVIG